MLQKFQSFVHRYLPQNFRRFREDESEKRAADNSPKTKIVRRLAYRQQKFPTSAAPNRLQRNKQTQGAKQTDRESEKYAIIFSDSESERPGKQAKHGPPILRSLERPARCSRFFAATVLLKMQLQRVPVQSEAIAESHRMLRHI